MKKTKTKRSHHVLGWKFRKYSLIISSIVKDSHFFNKRGIRVGEDISLLSSQRAARDVEVDPQVGVVSFYRHADVLDRGT